MCVALALTPDGVCRCLLVCYLAHRLSGGFCLPSCRGLSTVLVPLSASHLTPTHPTARLARNLTLPQGLGLCLLFKVTGDANANANGAPAWRAAFCVTSLWHCQVPAVD